LNKRGKMKEIISNTIERICEIIRLKTVFISDIMFADRLIEVMAVWNKRGAAGATIITRNI
jgi:hypothetical protein